MVGVCESNIIFPCVRPCVRRPSVCLSHYLLLAHWANSTKLATSLPLESNIFSVRQSFVYLSVTLSSPKPSGGNQTNLLHHFPSQVRETNIIFQSGRRPSICPPCYPLLKHWADFSQTCYITSPHDKGVQKQHFFPCANRPSICASRYVQKPLDGILPNLLHHFHSW